MRSNWKKYIKKVQIEARIMGDLAVNHILPAAIKYQNELLTNINGLKAAGLPETALQGTIRYPESRERAYPDHQYQGK